MKTRAKALPHPVLTPFSDDVDPNRFQLEWPPSQLNSDLVRWIISTKIEHDNHTIAELVKQKKAVYGLHVECPRTFFRAWYPHSETHLAVQIGVDKIWGKVELTAFCVAVSDILKYRIAGQHQDYANAQFELRSGDILAYSPTEEFEAFLDIDPIQKISSILDIKRSPDRVTGSALIDFEGNRIQVELSQQDWQNYIELRSDPAIKGLLASNIVFPAILQAMNYIKMANDNKELDDAKAAMRWCRSMVAKLETARIAIDGSPEEMFRSAQELLKEPVRRGLNDILEELRRNGS